MLSTPVLIAIAAALVLVIVFALYINSALSSAFSSAHSSTPKAYIPHFSAGVSTQDLLYVGNNLVVPYLLMDYNAFNTSQLSVNISIFRSAVPRSIYILNTDNECFNCGDSTAIGAAIVSNLLKYGVINNTSEIRYLDISNLNTLPPDAFLVVLNGLIPNAFFVFNQNANTSLMQSLLNRNTSIIYVGQNFSRMLLPGSIVVPSNYTKMDFLASTGPLNTKQGANTGYYFNSGTFSFVAGGNYGAITYVRAGGGSIVAFPNLPSTWPSSGDAGHDIAKAIQQLFWLDNYSSISLNATDINATGVLGLVLSPFALAPGALAGVNNSTMVFSIKASDPSLNSSAATYKHLYFSPHFNINGSVSMQQLTAPGATVPVTMTIFTRSKIPVSLQPHITVYALNMTPVGNIPLPSQQQAATSHSSIT